MSGPGAVVSIVNDGGSLPCPGFQMPAIAVIGEPFNAKRCFAFGYLLPVNSKKADAGMRQRLLFAKWRPLRAAVEDRGSAFAPWRKRIAYLSPVAA